MTTAKPILVASGPPGLATPLSAPGCRRRAGCETHMLHRLELDVPDGLRESPGANFLAAKPVLEVDAGEPLGTCCSGQVPRMN